MEKTIRGWKDELVRAHERMGDLFARSAVRGRSLAYLEGLLSGCERKNGWQLAACVGDASPYGMQYLPGRARWDADALQARLSEYVQEELGSADAVLVLDETGFLKKGIHSAGVQRQYSGTAGRIENSQVGVFLCYAGERGYVLLDRELYLPQDWVEDGPRCRAAGIPEGVPFQTKPMLGKQMLERAFQCGVSRGWVAGDEVYGRDSFTYAPQKKSSGAEAVGAFAAQCLGLRADNQRKTDAGLWEFGIVTGKKRSQMLCLRIGSELELVAGNNAIPLAERVHFGANGYSVDREAIRQLVDAATTGDSRYTPSNARREALKRVTQSRYESWSKAYRALKKRHLGMSDVWYSQRIAKMEIAQRSSAETIRKHIKR